MSFKRTCAKTLGTKEEMGTLFVQEVRLKGANCVTTCISDFLMRLFWLIYILWLLSSYHFPLFRGYGAQKYIGGKKLGAAVRWGKFGPCEL